MGRLDTGDKFYENIESGVLLPDDRDACKKPEVFRSYLFPRIGSIIPICYKHSPGIIEQRARDTHGRLLDGIDIIFSL